MRRCLIILLGLVAFLAPLSEVRAHPLDAACLERAKTTPMDCQSQHDSHGPTSVGEAAFDRLAKMQGKFPKSKSVISPTAVQLSLRYLQFGFVHILPKGLDHILFVIAVFLGARTWRQIVLQVSAFTLAHSLTLALAALGLIAIPAAIVEPLIAISIAVLALENIFTTKPKPWHSVGRTAIIFGFGLVHGLGFADVLNELGFDQGAFLLSLIAFNVGVEGGQLCVIAIVAVPAILLRQVLAREDRPQLYETILIRPASALIALIAVWWAFERVFLTG